MATATKPPIRNFGELERFIKEHPQQAQALAAQWAKLVKQIPQLANIKTAQAYQEFINSNPRLGLKPEDFRMKEVAEAFSSVRYEKMPQAEIKKPSLHAESTATGFVGTLLAAPLSLFVKPDRMEEDKNYKKIMGNLEKEWMQNRGKDFFQTQEGMDYYFGALDDFDKRTIHDDAEEKFREEHPEKAAEYDRKRQKNEKKISKKYGFFGKPEAENDLEYQKELGRMEQHKAYRFEELDKKIKSARDPAEKEMLKKEREELEKKIEEKHMHDFCKNNRVKAEAYATTNPRIKAALEEVKIKEEARKRQEEKEIEGEKTERERDVRSVEDKTHRPAPTMSAEEASRKLEEATRTTQPRPSGLIVPHPRQPLPPPPPPRTQDSRENQKPSGNFIDRINNTRDFIRNRISKAGKVAPGEMAGAGGATAAGGATGAGGGVVAVTGTAAGGTAAGIGITISGFAIATFLGLLFLIIVGVFVIFIIIYIIGCSTRLFPISFCGGEAQPIEDNTPIAGLTINKDVNPKQVVDWQTERITYTINVFYSGSEDVIIKDQIPTNTTLVEANPTFKPDFDSNGNATAVTWRLSDLPPTLGTRDNTKEYLLTLTVRPTKNDVLVTNIATAEVFGSSSVNQLLPNPLPEETAESIKAKDTIQNILAQNPDLVTTYKQAEAETGVPWQLLAGKHNIEGGSSPNKSLVSGRVIGTNEPDVARGVGCSSQEAGKGVPIPLADGGCGFATLLDSAIYAGNLLKRKIGKAPSTYQEAITALSRYNGGGNSNCGKGVPYAGCPADFEGEDDPYPLNYFDKKHDPMYLIYCADLTKCDPPKIFTRPGVMTIVRGIAN